MTDSKQKARQNLEGIYNGSPFSLEMGEAHISDIQDFLEEKGYQRFDPEWITLALKIYVEHLARIIGTNP